MEIELILTKEEINQSIPYNMICQTRYGSIWDTMRRKLRWNAEFSDDEKSKAEKIFRQTHNWSVGNGIPDTVRMHLSEIKLWNKIEMFCMSLYRR